MFALWMAAALLFPLLAAPQSDPPEEYRVYTEHPRLLLRAQRLRLLKRERERQSARWQQFATLIGGKAEMPEKGFAYALHYAVSGSAGSAKQAAAWALSSEAKDLRQIALVYDWCQPALPDEQNKALRARLQRGLEESARAVDVPTVRAAVFAALVLGDTPEPSTTVLRRVVREWWRGSLAPGLRGGTRTIARDDVYPLLELFHAIRDNLNIDLRLDAVHYFQTLPAVQLLGYYPAVFPAPENEYRIPSYPEMGEPDLRKAVMSRAAELSIVAFDNNALESQYLQGWLNQDRFMMQGALGIPYEFLWANPYQPGLSYTHVPLVLHDKASGRLFARSSWDEDALWAGYSGSQLQVFTRGQIKIVPLRGAEKPLVIGEATLLPAIPGLRFTRTPELPARMFIVGLQPKAVYQLEIDDEEVREVTADVGGIVAVDLKHRDHAGFRLTKR